MVNTVKPITSGFPGGSDGKASAQNAGDQGSIPRSGRSPWRRKWQPTPLLLHRKFHGWRSLVGYSPWGRRESDMTERLQFHHLSNLQIKTLLTLWGFPCGSVVKNPPAMQEPQETWVQSLGREDPLEKSMAIQSSILAWRIPWTEEPGGLQSTRSQRVRHNWSELASTHLYFLLPSIIVSLSSNIHLNHQ